MGAPHQARAGRHRPDEPIRSREADREDRAHEPAGAQGRTEQPHPALAHLQQLDRGDHEQRVQERAGHHLAEHSEHRPAGDRPAAKRAQAVQEPQAPASLARAPGRVARLLEAQPGEGQGRAKEGDRGRHGAEGRHPGRDQNPGRERPDDASEALAGAPRHVRGDQLSRAAGHRWHQRGERGPDGCARCGHDRREREQQDVRGIRRDDQRAQQRRDGPREPEREQEPLRPEALQDRSGEHPRQDGRDHPHRAKDAGGHDAVADVDDDEQHHEQAGVGGDPEGPRHLQAPDALVGHRRPE